MPANLQGIWNDKMWAPWEADYHLNINLQMNYWPADLCNLSETVDPLVDWLARLSEKGNRFREGGSTTREGLALLPLDEPLRPHDPGRFDEAVTVHEQRARSTGRDLDGHGALAALRVHA